MNFPDLHRHLGGATHPRILWGFLQNHGRETEISVRLRKRFPEYESFLDFFNRPFADLADYLTVHHLVEELQAQDVSYFALRAVRGAAVFEALDYLELRFNPYKRTPSNLPEAERIALMEPMVRAIYLATKTEFPIATGFILCMDRGFSPSLNRAIVHLAAKMPEVVAVDLAGPYQMGGPSIAEWAVLYEEAKSLGLKTTAHMAESDPDDIHPTLFPFLNRIGHGIQIALHRPDLLPELAERGICFEVCPTTYLRTNTVRDLGELRPVFERCESIGVPIAIATDNPALHGEAGRLVNEYEKLVRADAIHFGDIPRLRENGYRHAFAPASPV